MNKTNKLKKRLAVGALVASVATVGCLRAGAAPITIQNSDFSNYAKTFPEGNPAVNGYAGAPADWTVTSSVAGTGADALVQPGSFNYGITHNGNKPFTYYGLIIFGQYGPNTVVSQQTSYDAQVGDTLTAGTQFFVPWTGGDQTTSGDMALTIGGVVVAENTGIGTLTSLGSGEGSVADITFNYTVTSLSPTGAVGVELLSPATATADGAGRYNTQYFYDNVSLSVTPAAAPEPTTWAMLFAGLVSLVGWQRMRRTS